MYHHVVNIFITQLVQIHVQKILQLQQLLTHNAQQHVHIIFLILKDIVYQHLQHVLDLILIMHLLLHLNVKQHVHTFIKFLHLKKHV